MLTYCPPAYRAMHQGIGLVHADLKSVDGQQRLDRELQRCDLLLTSFRPAALKKLGLGWPQLHRRWPHLSQIAIIGATGDRAEEPGHDLTYMAEQDLLPGLELPASLYADMGGSLLAVEAALAAILRRSRRQARAQAVGATPRGDYREIALSDAAGYLALPRSWGLTHRTADVGGGHAGYQIYPCKNGRVAMAALEPHFAARLLSAAGLPVPQDASACAAAMRKAEVLKQVAAWAQSKTRQQLDKLAHNLDIPLFTMTN
jgi:crotonobetainyl-CoA:carnitine CoA-transferase CaiB-like acyl-CoA transferase